MKRREFVFITLVAGRALSVRALPGLDQKLKNGDAPAMQRVIEAGG